MILRQSTPADAEHIAALHAESWRNTYGAVLDARYLSQVVPAERRQLWEERLMSPEPNQHVIVAEVQDRIVGFACVFSGQHDVWGSYLDNLHVSVTQQGQGLGRALFAAVAQWCESQTPGRGLYLYATQNNLRAQGFYLDLGARIVEQGVWDAPDGGKVPTYCFLWDSVVSLAQPAPPSR